MMTKKSEMAEWILDFFRRAKVGIGQVVMFRVVQNKLLELSPKERDLFTPVANELIANGYFTYEEGALQNLRLTKKGYNYIFNPEAVLDCCYDQWEPTKAQSKYIANWHDSFLAYIRNMLAALAVFEASPTATEEDKEGLETLKLVLLATDVQEVENDLGSGNVKKSTIDKIEKISKRITDICIEHIQTSPMAREFWKQMIHLKIENDKQEELMRLSALRIPVGDS